MFWRFLREAICCACKSTQFSFFFLKGREKYILAVNDSLCYVVQSRRSSHLNLMVKSQLLLRPPKTCDCVDAYSLAFLPQVLDAEL